MSNKKLEQQLLASQIHNFLNKKLIRPSKSLLSYAAFYKNSEIPRLVINYKPLNIVRHPIPNKKDLLKRLTASEIFSKFDLKSGFWQIQIQENDKYKIVSTIPFKHYEWNVMNDIFIPYSSFSIVNIDDILTFLKEQYFKTYIHFTKLFKPTI
ncbi:hypothetical protein CFOL_v3_16686 [Cephalotus follicularis]|uniref:RVT_1 domain-containing protein n=1 Tax=Cephalotus follicularis TaxID=3775 RepID=A0A1Q3BYX0_CEPFO|nr:hypothetical protein CFOL_v3_16686 [Cephalotus follicularis]